MPRTNGHATDEHALATKTLKGDLSDIALRQIKQLTKPFAELSEADQREVIRAVEREAEQLIRKAVYLIAAGDRHHVTGTLGDVKVGKAIECKVSIGLSAGGRHALMDAGGTEVLLLMPNPRQFLGERKAAKAPPDQLGLPIAPAEAEIEHAVSPA